MDDTDYKMTDEQSDAVLRDTARRLCELPYLGASSVYDHIPQCLAASIEAAGISRSIISSVYAMTVVGIGFMGDIPPPCLAYLTQSHRRGIELRRLFDDLEAEKIGGA